MMVCVCDSIRFVVPTTTRKLHHKHPNYKQIVCTYSIPTRIIFGVCVCAKPTNQPTTLFTQKDHRTKRSTRRINSVNHGWQLHCSTVLYLFLSGLIEGRILQETASVVDLDNVSIAGEFSAATFLDIDLTGVLCESPLGRL